MKVSIVVNAAELHVPHHAPIKFTIERPKEELDNVWSKIAGIIGSSKHESYGLKIEDMYNAIKEEGGKRLIVEIFNLGLSLTEDLGVYPTDDGFCYVHGLENSFRVGDWDMNKSAVAVHFVDYCLRMAEDKSDEGKLDFVVEFDYLIDSLRQARTITA